MTLKMDVLPAPLRPMMPQRSPSATVKVMFLKSSVAYAVGVNDLSYFTRDFKRQSGVFPSD